MNTTIVIAIAILYLILANGGAGYCVREYDMWCSSQAPQETLSKGIFFSAR